MNTIERVTDAIEKAAVEVSEAYQVHEEARLLGPLYQIMSASGAVVFESRDVQDTLSKLHRLTSECYAKAALLALSTPEAISDVMVLAGIDDSLEFFNRGNARHRRIVSEIIAAALTAAAQE